VRNRKLTELILANPTRLADWDPPLSFRISMRISVATAAAAAVAGCGGCGVLWYCHVTEQWASSSVVLVYEPRVIISFFHHDCDAAVGLLQRHLEGRWWSARWRLCGGRMGSFWCVSAFWRRSSSTSSRDDIAQVTTSSTQLDTSLLKWISEYTVPVADLGRVRGPPLLTRCIL